MKNLKIIGYSILTLIIAVTLFKLYDVNFNYRLREVTKNKVYSSGVIPTDKLKEKLTKLGIKTVIDLRIDSNLDPLNPSSESKISAEKAAIDKIKGISYVNISSGQKPSEKNIKDFLTVLDKKDAYPVLIHCHHGIGRAVLYSALYRIEYENFTNEDARQKTCFPLMFSNFDKNTTKGKFLTNYQKRNYTQKTYHK